MKDPLRLVFPPAASSLLVGLFFLLTVPGLHALGLPRPFGLAVWSGGLAGYVAYDTLHYVIVRAGRPQPRARLSISPRTCRSRIPPLTIPSTTTRVSRPRARCSAT